MARTVVRGTVVQDPPLAETEVKVVTVVSA